jgi:hypothetical protein
MIISAENSASQPDPHDRHDISTSQALTRLSPLIAMRFGLRGRFRNTESNEEALGNFHAPFGKDLIAFRSAIMIPAVFGDVTPYQLPRNSATGGGG